MSKNAEKKRALRARIADGTVGESRFNAPAKVGTGHGRAEVSLTLADAKGKTWLYKLPIDPTDQDHVRDGVKLVKVALR